MTTAREKLAQLAEADFDTFGEPAGLVAELDLSPEEWVAIRGEIWDAPWSDASRFPDCLVEAVKVLGEIGLQGDPFSRRAATQCLRGMAYRAKTGMPYGEPQEPAWSLDAERERRFERVLDEDERTGN